MDEDYPEQLRDIQQMPPFLFTLGELRRDDVGVCVVGSRNVSPQGRDLAAEVATALVADGLTVVSGLADGVDTAAHRATLAAGGGRWR